MQVRRVGTTEWERVRELRLRALADAPEAFGSSLEREAAFSKDDWTDRLGTVANGTFVCALDGEDCGMVTVVRNEADERLGWLVGMWVAPASRHTGAADELVVAALHWAGQEGIAALTLLVTEHNARATRLYERHGFQRTGTTMPRGRDAVSYIEMSRPTPRV